MCRLTHPKSAGHKAVLRVLQLQSRQHSLHCLRALKTAPEQHAPITKNEQHGEGEPGKARLEGVSKEHSLNDGQVLLQHLILLLESAARVAHILSSDGV